MSRPWILESFDAASLVTASGAESGDSELEEDRLRAFDQGYKDGWDDAAKAHAEEQRRISAELAANLQAHRAASVGWRSTSLARPSTGEISSHRSPQR